MAVLHENLDYSICISVIVSFTGCALDHAGQRNRLKAHYEVSHEDRIVVPGTIQTPRAHISRVQTQRAFDTLPPRSIADGEPDEFWDLSLEEVTRTALSRSPVMRQLGVNILSTPNQLQTIYDPAIALSHPQFGEEAARSAFDARLSHSFVHNDSDLPFNNRTQGGGAFVVKGDEFRAFTQVQKTSQTGGRYGLSLFATHQHNDAPANRFSHVWLNGIEFTIRQPLLQGSGSHINSVITPGSQAGNMTPGILLTRINSRITGSEFELGVRDFLNDLETCRERS